MKPGKNQQFWIVASVAIGTFMSGLDYYAINISLPTIAEHFKIDTGTVSWVILSYLLVVTSTMLLFGKLMDRIDAKKIHIMGYLFFLFGSALSGASTCIWMLLAARCIQGAGGAMLRTSSLIIIPKFLPRKIIGRIFGFLALFGTLGITIGAPVGGLITGFFSWRWIFFINIPVVIITILIAARAIPGQAFSSGKKGPQTEEFDIAGALLSFGGLFLLLLGLNMGMELGWTSPVILSCFMMSVVLIAGFVLWEKRCDNPILEFGLFRAPGFNHMLLASFMGYMVLAGLNFLMPFYFELGKNLEVQQVGLIMLIYSGVCLLVGPVAGHISDGIKPYILCSTSMFFCAAACFIFYGTLAIPGLLYAVIFLILIGFSFGMFMPCNKNMMIRVIPPERPGISVAVYMTTNNLGLVLGVCAFETIFSQVVGSPTGIQKLSFSIASLSPAQVFPGFREACIIAGGICLFAAIFNILCGKTREIKAGAHPGFLE